MLAIENPKACGIGEGEQCCAFLTMGQGFQCGRTDPSIHATIVARLSAGTTNAKYDPGSTPFPECQSSREKVE